MDPDKSVMLCGLRICTFNCRSIKNSIHDVQRLCTSHDIICIQEHWLLPTELELLSNIHTDFFGIGSSAVNISDDLLVGRPYGGTAILFRKSLSHLIKPLSPSNSRVTGMKVISHDISFLLLSVYMPTEYNDDDSLENYVDMCAHLNALITDIELPHVVIVGDFNCQTGSRFFDVLSDLMVDANLTCSDLPLLSGADNPSVFTYCSDSGANTSWIDHIVCSYEMNNIVSDVNVLHDFMCSDHRPLSFLLNHMFSACESGAGNDSHIQRIVHDWSRADLNITSLYSEVLFNNLSHISVPNSLHSCYMSRCNDSSHACIIDDYYRDVIMCINSAVEQVIPVKTVNANQYNVAGWNDFAQEKYDISRDAFLDWVHSGRPRTGAVFIRMSRSRAQFKLALRYCRQHEDQLRADACAKSLDFHDSKSFWNNVKKINCNKATKYAISVGGVTGDDKIAALWRDHFNGLYNSIDDDDSKVAFFNRVNSCCNNSVSTSICVQEIRDAILLQKKGKAAGPDGLSMEAFIFANANLHAHLCFLFNLFISHQHIPAAFMKSVIVPLVKAKGGDLSDLNNYRAIALSNAITKIFESVLTPKVTCRNDDDSYQFGFKSGHSTGLCTNTMKKTIDYYTGLGSYVFVCFVDFSKAFDKVNYWKLFNKLLDDDIDSSIVSFLAVWYSNQQSCIRWKNTVSDSFNIGNGTRQGGLLSPYFFTRYIRELICAIAHSNIGCSIGGMSCNILAYADDIVLLAPSWRALQSLIDLLAIYALNIDMSCNANKTVCMVFKPKRRNMAVEFVFPQFTINNVALEFVSEFKYLGHMICNSFSDDVDIKREIRNLFMRSNVLIRRFSKCSTSVKLQLFKSFCLCLYDVGLWGNYSATVFNKLRSCYHKCIKMFFGFDRLYSVTQMLLQLNLPSFDNLILNCINSFHKSCSAAVGQNVLISNLNTLCLL
jgi:exonuclease III